MKAKFELADIIKRFGHELVSNSNPTPYQPKTLHKLVQCRTASLGGHEEQCDCCGEKRYSYNSCRNRHCPKCQASKQAVWIEQLLESTLPVKHYHIVFTLPHCLNKICLYNEGAFYRLLFSAVWRTLHSFSYTHFGAETGAICVLHTWGQNLSLHPCPAGRPMCIVLFRLPDIHSLGNGSILVQMKIIFILFMSLVKRLERNFWIPLKGG